MDSRKRLEPGRANHENNADSESTGARRQPPWEMVPILGVVQIVNVLLYLLLGVVPFYSDAAQNVASPAASFAAPFSWEPVGSVLLGAAGFAVSFGRLLGLGLMAALVLMIPAAWRKLTPMERVMWSTALLVGVLIYAVTWSQSWEIQQWVMASSILNVAF